MKCSVAIVGTPSSIGIRPYVHGGTRHLGLAPGALREQGLRASTSPCRPWTPRPRAGGGSTILLERVLGAAPG